MRQEVCILINVPVQVPWRHWSWQCCINYRQLVHPYSPFSPQYVFFLCRLLVMTVHKCYFMSSRSFSLKRGPFSRCRKDVRMKRIWRQKDIKELQEHLSILGPFFLLIRAKTKWKSLKRCDRHLPQYLLNGEFYSYVFLETSSIARWSEGCQRPCWRIWSQNEAIGNWTYSKRSWALVPASTISHASGTAWQYRSWIQASLWKVRYMS